MARPRSQTGTSSSRQTKLKPAEVLQKAREQVEELFGHSPDSISGFSADGNGGWVVTLDVVEVERIPPTTSLLGSYEVKLDKSGELTEYKRLRRYARNQADQQEES